MRHDDRPVEPAVPGRRTFVGAMLGGAVGLGASSAVASTKERNGSNVRNEATARSKANGQDPMDYRGRNVRDLPTPALLIDLDAMESNLDRMVEFYRPKPTTLRPHVKTHKSPVIARQQLARGAVGICAAKVSEAEVFVEAGIENVLVTSPVATPDRVAAIIEMARRSPGVQVVVDRAGGVRDLSAAAQAAGLELTVVVDLDTGMHRTGIDPGPPADALVRAILEAPGLRFGGLQAYAGHLMHVEGFAERKARSEATLAPAVACRRRLEAAGIDVPVLTGGGTGTYDIDGDVDGMTDIQVGSYLFMDVNYRAVGGRNGPVFDDFAPALFVLATAISQPVPDRITIDAGYKAFAADQQPPEPFGLDGVTYRWGGDEHGILMLDHASRRPALGERIRLIASHCDPTVNLYDTYYACRGDVVEDVWPVAARGRSQ